MTARKEMKRAAKKNLKRHYWVFAAACLIAVILGAEYTGTFNMAQNNTDSYEASASDTGSSGGTIVKKAGAVDVLDQIINGDAKQGEALAESLRKEHIAKAKDGSPALARTRGVLAQAVNSVTSGSVFVTIAAALNSVTGSASIILSLLILLSLILFVCVWFFITNVFTVISRRIFLEGRCYDALPIQRFLFLFRVKKWGQASLTLFLQFLFQSLWALTIVGGIIKSYSYYMVPYIVAENPAIPSRQAITLSRKMMKGHKWECFVLELTFAGWYFLGMITFGLSCILYSNPYKAATFAEYYVRVRQSAVERSIEGSHYLNDSFLYKKPDSGLLYEAYADVIELLNKPQENLRELTGISRFFADYFGILLTNSAKEKAYEKDQADRAQLASLVKASNGQSYPGRLFPIPEVQKRSHHESIHYLRHYSVCSIIMLFFIFSFIGWVWEVSLHLIGDGVFVNRGVLHGPWLPIYGSGGTMILILLNRLRRHPALQFFGIIVLCGIVEYFTSYFLEITQGQKWWDYTGYFLNLHGRICAEGLLVFGAGGMAIVYVLAPLLDNAIKRIRLKILLPVCLLLLGIYIGDSVYSQKNPNTGKGITDYQSRL